MPNSVNGSYGEQGIFDIALNGSGANAAGVFLAAGLLFSLAIIPLNSSYVIAGTPTLTIRNGNDIIIDNKAFTAAVTPCYPQAATQTNALVATGLYMPFLLVGQSTVVVTGGSANGFLRIVPKFYP